MAIMLGFLIENFFVKLSCHVSGLVFPYKSLYSLILSLGCLWYKHWASIEMFTLSLFRGLDNLQAMQISHLSLSTISYSADKLS